MRAPVLAPASFLLVCMTILTGCQTPRHLEFDAIREGMVKGDVIQTAGNPTRTQRWQGKDRWIYVYYPDEKTVDVKEVHFLEGRVTYKGAPPIPPSSAEEQDRINAESNLAEEQRLVAEKEAAAAAKASAAEALSGETPRTTPPAAGSVD